MSVAVFNKRDKLSAPPFVTVSVEDNAARRNIFRTWSKVEKCGVGEKSFTFSSEGELLKAFVVRKGTQLRLEKAMMLTRRILTLVLRWKTNACWDDFCKFKDAFESDGGKLEPRKKEGKKTARVKGRMHEIRLPSRQWANWVIYLSLRDLLLLSKIKYECERTVGYWLGLISCSHHPGDSLIIVGILSRIWAVSSGMVEDYANQVYPSLSYMSSLLSPTKADNWLEDIDFPNDLFTWLEKILGFPFQPAQIGGYEQFFRTDETRKGGGSKMDRVLDRVFRSSSQDDKKLSGVDVVASTSSGMRDLGDDDEEDLGVPVVNVQSTKVSKVPRKRKKKQKLAQQINKKGLLDERWQKFFKNFKSKLTTELGRKQLLTRIKKYKKTESNPQITSRLVKFHKFVTQDNQEKLLVLLPKFKRFLLKNVIK